MESGLALAFWGFPHLGRHNPLSCGCRQVSQGLTLLRWHGTTFMIYSNFRKMEGRNDRLYPHVR